MRVIKYIALGLLGLFVIATAGLYAYFASSLPRLDGELKVRGLQAQGSIERDKYGQAIINAQSQHDAAFLLGYAHAQDRLFQMDLLRRSAAGELSEVVGEVALERDKYNRFFQFRAKAQNVVLGLPSEHQRLLESYANGVNAFLTENGAKTFEFLLAGSEMKPWLPEDTVLATYSMYIDLQSGQVERDFENTAIQTHFGQAMIDFMYQPSSWQAAIDLSVESAPKADIPAINKDLKRDNPAQSIESGSDSSVNEDSINHFVAPSEIDGQDIGSNNWAVSGELTDTQSAMLSSDMHLGLNVPIIWYRAQLNYLHEGQSVKMTGVSLPGTPLIIAGSNGHIAWGFTNSNVDNVDWIELEEDTETTLINEEIKIKDSPSYTLEFEMSKFGPVRKLAKESGKASDATSKSKRFALSWVALEDYAVNMDIADMPKQRSVDQALALAKTVAIPVQNMVVADDNGDIAWQLTGAITSRSTPSLTAISEEQYDPNWKRQDISPAFVKNPENNRIWSANARVISTLDLPRYGDGGYALGARQRQIADLLFEKDRFTEQDFNQIQLNNEAMFLQPWHNLLLNTLKNNPQRFALDIEQLKNWGSCACPDSVGYTLVRRFRSEVIKTLMQPIEEGLTHYDVNLRHSMRLIETAIWQILDEKPQTWLPSDALDYTDMLIKAYTASKDRLITAFDANPDTLEGLEWGKVNALKITHPFAGSLGPFGSMLNMVEVEGFGDSFMPAVQTQRFGASQRLIVRPGELDKAILTVPGGQSMHPLSAFFDMGFDEYAAGGETPLLPGEVLHQLRFIPLME
uniref:penicillin acylase family protein n=1 Tax=Ningiella ruwaisensis TaxID=2364274 RepID=UPI00109FA43E|nr:penicillin acylase family protein [Ningiella ruwaisensis]